MSLDAVLWALRDADPPDAISHVILIGIANHANPDGTAAYPTVETLSKYAHCGRRTVFSKLRLLEECGLIRRGDQRLVAHLRAGYRPIVWDVAVGAKEAESDQESEVQNVHPADSEVHGGASRGAPSGISGVHTSAHITVLKPSNKPSIDTSAAEAADPPRLDVETLCTRLVEHMTANGCRTPTVTARWRDEARRLLDRDGIPLEEALTVLDWSQNDEFWKRNILSLPKFREKYDRLRMAAKAKPVMRDRAMENLLNEQAAYSRKQNEALEGQGWNDLQITR
ncbi:helix-turn-helix domain-containing protein [Dermabacteraceae bacterium TAE3-ERU27]|nr:helix-turn-helix domain-containing protein [Dermabacteraceae bacterium TAE3-ERU27]